MKLTPIRPYVVTDKTDKTKRLVKATSQAAARNYVARDQYIVHVASANDVIDLIAAGVVVESATEADPETEPKGE
jgi:hypothetical protein